MNKLEVKNLTKIFNGKLAINKINFSLEENTILGILGPNGLIILLRINGCRKSLLETLDYIHA